MSIHLNKLFRSISLSVKLILFSLCLLQAQGKERVAILETISQEVDLSPAALGVITDQFRTVALNLLPTEQFHIMTKDNIMMMLPPGTEISECVGECLVETGKNINAHLISQGTITKVGSRLFFTASLYETRKSQLIGQISVMAKDIDGVIDGILEQSPTLFTKVSPKENQASNEWTTTTLTTQTSPTKKQSTYPRSSDLATLYEQGLEIDIRTLANFEVQYNVEIGGIPKALIYALYDKAGAGFIFHHENLNTSNEEYFALLDENQVKSFEYYTDTPTLKIQTPYWELLQKDYIAHVQKWDFHYRSIAWVYKGTNYRVLFWTLKDEFDSAVADIEKTIKTIRPKNN